MKTMKLKKENKGEYTKFVTEADYLKFEVEIDQGGYGQYKIFNGGYEMEASYNSSLDNMIQNAEELEEQYKLYKKFLNKIKKNHKINKCYHPGFIVPPYLAVCK
jgi:hypothetical protein